MPEPQVALAASPREWSGRLHRYVADHGGARVRATVLHPQDALAERYDVFVVDDTTSFLTHRLVSELHRSGRRVLGVYDEGDPRGKGELVDLGVDDVIPRTASAEEFVRAIELLAATGAAVDALAPAAQPASTPQPARGMVTAVGGPAGGCGATEVAIALGAAVGTRGQRAVLVDVDEVAPSVAQRLDLPLYPNLRAAVDSVERGTGSPLSSATGVTRGFAALPGLSSAGEWAELRPAELAGVTDRLTAACDHVLLNVGHRLEDLGGAGGPARYGQTRAALELADQVVAVGLPSPVSLARLLQWAAEAAAIAPAASVHLVVNRASVGAFRRAEVEAELRRTFQPATLSFLPTDERVDAAAWAGGVVGSGRFARAVAALADAALPGPSRRSRRLLGRRR